MSNDYDELRRERDDLKERADFLVAMTREAQAFASNYATEVLELREENARLLAERDRLEKALNAMMTQFGMDEDEWSKPTFDQARAALSKEPRNER